MLWPFPFPPPPSLRAAVSFSVNAAAPGELITADKRLREELEGVADTATGVAGLDFAAAETSWRAAARVGVATDTREGLWDDFAELDRPRAWGEERLRGGGLFLRRLTV